MMKTVPRHSVIPPLRDAFDADIFTKVAEACTATCDFLYVGFWEPAPFPIWKSNAFHPAWRNTTTLKLNATQMFFMS